MTVKWVVMVSFTCVSVWSILCQATNVSCYDEEQCSVMTLFSFQAFIHSHMRAKTSDLLKILNRARPEQVKDKKTISLVLLLLLLLAK